MPIIETFTKKFNLFIYNVQNEAENNLKQYQSEELILSYNKNNQLACREFNQQYPLNQVSSAKTNYFYQYNINKDRLSKQYGYNSS